MRGSLSETVTIPRDLNAHIWEREANEHYVEPAWCSKRLFEEIEFKGAVYDPCCGFGTIVKSAKDSGLHAYGSDLVNRGWDSSRTPHDFLTTLDTERHDNIVCNPPFNIAANFARKALQHARRRVAMVFPTARLNAAHWLKGTPLEAVWLMTPRPSMPPGHTITAGEKPGGGKMDFCWLVWNQEHAWPAELYWLRRDG